MFPLYEGFVKSESKYSSLIHKCVSRAEYPWQTYVVELYFVPQIHDDFYPLALPRHFKPYRFLLDTELACAEKRLFSKLQAIQAILDRGERDRA